MRQKQHLFEFFFGITYTVILILELIFENTTNFTSFHYFTKPLLVGSLIVFFLIQNPLDNVKTKQLILTALVFSLLGDISLMFTEINSLFFIGGLLAFLTAHIFYIIVFLKKRNSSKNIITVVLFLSIYAIILFYFLKDGLEKLLIPVIVYMIAILTMGVTAFLRQERVSKISFILVFIGALLFILSDSLLAINKFYNPIPYSRIGIMTTYAIAQFFIILGLKKQ